MPTFQNEKERPDRGAEFEALMVLRRGEWGGVSPPQPTRCLGEWRKLPQRGLRQSSADHVLAHFELESPFGDKKCAIALTILGPFFISNRSLLTGHLVSARLSVEKERLGTRFRRRHAFDPMPAIWMVWLSSFQYRTKLSMFAQFRQNRTPIRNIIHFIHISLRYKTALSTKTVKHRWARQILAG